MLKNNNQFGFELDTTIEVKDANGNPLVVGDTYEMFVPVAKHASETLGIVWTDDKDYTFKYAGAALLGGTLTICTADIKYNGALGEEYLAGATITREVLGGVSPLCPNFVAAKFVRPVTNG